MCYDENNWILNKWIIKITIINVIVFNTALSLLFKYTYVESYEVAL